jgi:hypothetical protein
MYDWRPVQLPTTSVTGLPSKSVAAAHVLTRAITKLFVRTCQGKVHMSGSEQSTDVGSPL